MLPSTGQPVPLLYAILTWSRIADQEKFLIVEASLDTHEQRLYRGSTNPRIEGFYRSRQQTPIRSLTFCIIR
jgi:23S rRNA G2445 N2-methylase RlmL